MLSPNLPVALSEEQDEKISPCRRRIKCDPCIDRSRVYIPLAGMKVSMSISIAPPTAQGILSAMYVCRTLYNPSPATSTVPTTPIPPTIAPQPKLSLRPAAPVLDAVAALVAEPVALRDPDAEADFVEDPDAEAVAPDAVVVPPAPAAPASVAVFTALVADT